MKATVSICDVHPSKPTAKLSTFTLPNLGQQSFCAWHRFCFLFFFFLFVFERPKSLMNGEGTDNQGLFLLLNFCGRHSNSQNAFWEMPLWFNFPEVVLINYVKDHISAGGSLSKKHFKSHDGGDTQRDVCIVSVNLVVESAQLPV